MSWGESLLKSRFMKWCSRGCWVLVLIIIVAGTAHEWFARQFLHQLMIELKVHREDYSLVRGEVMDTRVGEVGHEYYREVRSRYTVNDTAYERWFRDESGQRTSTSNRASPHAQKGDPDWIYYRIHDPADSYRFEDVAYAWEHLLWISLGIAGLATAGLLCLDLFLVRSAIGPRPYWRLWSSPRAAQNTHQLNPMLLRLAVWCVTATPYAIVYVFCLAVLIGVYGAARPILVRDFPTHWTYRLETVIGVLVAAAVLTVPALRLLLSRAERRARKSAIQN